MSFEGRDALMSLVSFMDQSDVGENLGPRFITYRTIANIEVVRILPMTG
jgi:hypothetical protein